MVTPIIRGSRLTADLLNARADELLAEAASIQGDVAVVTDWITLTGAGSGSISSIPQDLTYLRLWTRGREGLAFRLNTFSAPRITQLYLNDGSASNFGINQFYFIASSVGNSDPSVEYCFADIKIFNYTKTIALIMTQNYRVSGGAVGYETVLQKFTLSAPATAINYTWSDQLGAASAFKLYGYK